MAKDTLKTKVEKYAKRRDQKPALAVPGFKDTSPLTIRDYAAFSPLSIDKNDGPFITKSSKTRRKPRL